MICGCISPKDKAHMKDIAHQSGREGIELAAAIMPPCKIGDTLVRGTNKSVEPPRPQGAQGTYHTHPSGTSTPSLADLHAMMTFRDSVSCIAQGKEYDPKIACYSPNEGERDRYDGLGILVRMLSTDVQEFATGLTSRYGKPLTELVFPKLTAEEQVRALELKDRAAKVKRGLETWRDKILTSCEVS